MSVVSNLKFIKQFDLIDLKVNIQNLRIFKRYANNIWRTIKDQSFYTETYLSAKSPKSVDEVIRNVITKNFALLKETI